MNETDMPKESKYVAESTSTSVPSSTSGASSEVLICPTYDSSWMYCSHDTPRCEKSTRAFEQKGRLPPICERPQLAQHFQRQKILSMLASNYDEADKYNQLKKQFSEACATKDLKNNRNYYIIDVERKIDSTKDISSKCNSKWDKKNQ